MIKVFVVAWMFTGGGGFDWYKKPKAADKAFEHEDQSVKDLSDQHWTAFRFDVEVTSFETATDEIEAVLDDLCEAAGQKKGPITFPYNPESFSPKVARQ